MCAMLIGFCGSPFRGMQYQKAHPDHASYPTVEGTLFDALCRAGAISKDNSDDPLKVNLSRAARTDSGVHAAGNTVSFKMIMSVPGQGDMLTRINEELPPEIRVWDFVRVKNSFNARTMCDSRRYTYFFPSYLLIPPKPGSGFVRAMERYLGKPSEAPVDSFWSSVDLEHLGAEEETKRKRAWRVPPELIARLQTITPQYEGTHNFHNFTITNTPNASSNKRYMKKIEILDPQVHDGTEWIPVHFHGQSFMLHQRKMMFALIMICRTNTPPHVITELYRLPLVAVPKVPALGLLLEAPVYGEYNKNVIAANEKLGTDSLDYRPPIDFEKLTDKMEDFKQKFIYSSMRGIETRTGLFDAWIQMVDNYDGDDLLYLNPEGTIPEAAIINGQKRPKRFKENRVFDKTAFVNNDAEKATEVIEVMEDDDEEEEVALSKKEAAEMEG
ncbi:pseudouridine synthase [Hymenopellis radicata]|nr:pseudouridine synthase [Hymenopellis radicata]